MRLPWPLALLSVSFLANPPAAFGGVDSQARAVVEPLPALISDVFSCGVWNDGTQRGRYRVVLAEVSGGAGTEIYIQRVAETIEAGAQVLRVVSTTPIQELNNDHAQYQVSNARCIGGSTVELQPTFEHDGGNVQRRIRLVPTRTGYKLSNIILRKGKRGR